MLLMVLLLASCGQPLQISTPSQTQTRPTRLPSETALPNLPASSVPSAPTLEQSIPETGATPPPTATEPAPIELPAPEAATPTPAIIVVPRTQEPENNQQRWRARQQDRKVNDPPRIYVANNPVTLWWYDPLTSQSLPIGTIIGEFPVQAEFILLGAGQAALEVPYVINADFGLTAISEAVRERMSAAGYSQSVEAYILRTDDVQPK
jgi:hypothetical protein